jgi:predicted transcriptional regulator
MKVLLSIKPEFAEKIFSGEKKYEYRRSIFRNRNIKTIIVYASSPVSKIIGEFEVELILTDKIKHLWEQTKIEAGISEEYFFNYFDGKEDGHAIRIKKSSKYARPYSIERKYGVKPPQSFLYV